VALLASRHITTENDEDATVQVSGDLELKVGCNLSGRWSTGLRHGSTSSFAAVEGAAAVATKERESGTAGASGAGWADGRGKRKSAATLGAAVT
jgi:hypothetical protein